MSVSCSTAPKFDNVDVADPVVKLVIGRNTAAIRARVVQKTSLPNRSSVPMATYQQCKHWPTLGMEWLFPPNLPRVCRFFGHLFGLCSVTLFKIGLHLPPARPTTTFSTATPSMGSCRLTRRYSRKVVPAEHTTAAIITSMHLVRVYMVAFGRGIGRSCRCLS
jgi:hypothetical protein